MKQLGKLFAVVLGLVCVLYAGMFASLSMFHSPVYAWRVLTMFFADTGDYRVFPSRAMETRLPASPLPAGEGLDLYEIEYPYRGGVRREPLQQLLERTDTSAFLIVQHDRLVYETYLQSTREQVNTSFSVAKSFDSALIGAAIADGLIGSVDERVIAYVPEIAGRGLDDLTIRNLLRMDSGIRYRSEAEIFVPFSDDALTYYPPDLRRVARSVQRGDSPLGADFHYNNFHPLLEGLIIERAAGMPVATYLQERIWKPLGAEFPASWSLDSEASGFEKMESGINARAVDYARFGLLYLHQGVWNGQRILPAAWVAESTSPDPNDTRPFAVYPEWQAAGGYYGYHWWGKRHDGGYDFMARGNLGQLIYVAPGKNAVLVRLGSEGDEDVSWPAVAFAILQQLPD